MDAILGLAMAGWGIFMCVGNRLFGRAVQRQIGKDAARLSGIAETKSGSFPLAILVGIGFIVGGIVVVTSTL